MKTIDERRTGYVVECKASENASEKNYRKRGSASYIVREVLSVRERERERERERLIPKTIENRKRDCA